MNTQQANKILDAIKDNLSYNLDTINKALWLTGDLSDNEFERSGRADRRTLSQDGFAEGLDCLRQRKGKGA